jgi:hypothetical protein
MRVPERNLKITATIQGAPVTAICDTCGIGFQVSNADRKSSGEAAESLRVQFENHICKAKDVSHVTAQAAKRLRKRL